MWEKFRQRLGKIVQDVLNIFRKKKPQYEGTWTINGSPIDMKFSSASDDSLVGKSVVLEDGELFIDGESVGKVLGVEKIDLSSVPTQETGDMEDGLLKKLGNMAYPLLPKLIHVPTLIVSSYANWEYDSVGVDISQLEETGIAHYWCTTTEDADECSIVIEDAILLQWGDGYWEWSP